MYKELIELIIQYPQYFQTCKNIIRRTISDDTLNDNNQNLKKLLIKNIQKNNSQKIYKLLVWLFIQEKNFNKALDYEISIDKKVTDNLTDIIELANISLSNNDYKTTQKALQYVLKNSNPSSFNYEYSSWKLLEIEFEKLKKQTIKKKFRSRRVD